MFHENRELVNNLRKTDAYFEKVFQKHNALDEEVREMEKNHLNSKEIENKKKEKLKLKDELFSLLKVKQ